jgi:hypothetical protein
MTGPTAVCDSGMAWIFTDMVSLIRFHEETNQGNRALQL